MTRYELIEKIRQRKKEIGITVNNLAQLSGIGVRTVHRLLSGDDVKLSTVEKITETMGLDLAGNTIVPLDRLRKQRARQKARYLATLVQGTSTLEKQGLDPKGIDLVIKLFEDALLHGQYRNRLWVA